MQLMRYLAISINAGFEGGRHKTIEWKALVNAACEHGWTGTDKEGRTLLRDFIGYNAQCKVKVEDLMRWFRPQGAEPRNLRRMIECGTVSVFGGRF